SSDSLAATPTTVSASVVRQSHTATPSSSLSTPGTANRLPEPDADVIHIPSYSRWFAWNAIHECEARFVPEFFDGRMPSKNPKVYKYYRNAIIKQFRGNPSRKISFTEVRKTIIGDVGSIRRVFDFLETWGLINYLSPPKPQAKLDDKSPLQGGGDARTGTGFDGFTSRKRMCSSCKAPCTIACFASEKHDMTLCARCYVRGNYRVGLSSSDFQRIEICDDPKSDWNEKETLKLLEALMHYGDDWKKVGSHVGGRSAKECVAQFIKLPFGEQFHGPPESQNPPLKRICLTPLADSSNPIMAQAAFLSTLVGVDVAKVAAAAAVKALSNLGNQNILLPRSVLEASIPPFVFESELLDNESELDEAKSRVEEEAITELANQMKGIEDKIVGFEDVELRMDKRRQHFQQLQNQAFADQLTLLFAAATTKTGE
ncbi:hypothetical protein M569_01208, partial [Genlisea aurea]